MTTPVDSRTPSAPLRQGRVLAVSCLAMGVVVASMASLNVALPELARDLGASQTEQTWIIDAYSLVFATLLLPAGALGDRFGRRRSLVVGLVVYAAAALAATTVESAAALIGLRGVLGLAAALIMPATLSTITSTFPAEDRTRAVSTWALVAGGSGVVGLLASGLLLERWSWPAIFVFNVVLAVVALVGTLRWVPESADPHPLPLDLVGAVVSTIGVGALVYAIIEAPVEGWTAPRTVGGIAVGLLVLVGFVLVELRRPYPLLDPRLFLRRRFAAGTLSITAQFFAMFGFMFVVMQYLQLVRGLSALAAAASLLAMPLGMAPAARLSPWLLGRFGERRPWVAGLGLLAAGLLVLAHLDADASRVTLIAGLILLGAGLGLAMPPATTAITEALPAELQNVGSAVNDLARELGGALGIALLGSLLTAGYQSQLDTTGLPPDAAAAAESSMAGALAVGGPVVGRARDAFVGGLHLALVVAALTAALAAVAIAALLRRRTAE